MRLLGVLLHHRKRLALLLAHHVSAVAAAVRKCGEVLLAQRHQLLVVDAAAGDNHAITSMIVFVAVADAVRAHEAADHLTGADNLPSQVMRRIGGPGIKLEDVVVGRVLAAGNLLDDHLALRVDGLLGEYRGRHHVAKDLHNPWQLVIHKTGVVAGVLLGREGVLLGADALEILGDAKGVALVGALEHHMLQEMRDALLGIGLVARANLEPDA